MSLEPLAAQGTRRQVRIVGVLAGANAAGLSPVPTRQLHTIIYFADALSPVWGLRILDARLLKRREGPISAAVQHDIDALVGIGVVCASSVRHVEDADGLWRLEARYSLNGDIAGPIIDAIHEFRPFAREFEYVREVAIAMSGLGSIGIENASATDATYGDALVDLGGMVDIDETEGGPNQTALVALRFADLVPPDIQLSDAEKVHLYIRELYGRIRAT